MSVDDDAGWKKTSERERETRQNNNRDKRRNNYRKNRSNYNRSNKKERVDYKHKEWYKDRERERPKEIRERK